MFFLQVSPKMHHPTRYLLTLNSNMQVAAK
jgi:hypothetical protein